jgi:inner membrane protein
VPSVLSHPAVPLAVAASLGGGTVPPRLAIVACVRSAVPDLDSLGFMAGVPYSSPLGHRGFTHSLIFAVLLALLAAAFARRLGASSWVVLVVVLISTASNGILDAMTTGGMGVAFFSPFSNTRYFLPWRVILVSPISVTRFLSERGIAIMKSELLWVWLPCAVVAFFGVAVRRVVSVA